MTIKKEKNIILPIIGLLVLCIVPTAAGIFRLNQLITGTINSENIRFFESPIPVILHIISIIIFGIFGALQFHPQLRIKNNWHKIMGKIVLICGFISAISGLWMSQFYKLPAHDGTILYYERLLVGFYMIFSLFAGFNGLQKREFTKHRNFMIRAYAIGMGAGTQVLTNAPWIILIGEPSVFERAILMGLGWILNIIIAEIIIYKLNHKIRPHSDLMPSKKKHG